MYYALGALCLLCLILALRLHSLRHDLRELTEELHAALECDSNAALRTASGERTLRELTALWSEELRRLRSERRRLESGNNELTEAVTNIAHDLRTPLTAISGYAELLQQQPLDDKEAEYVSIIRERTDNLRELTEELFSYSLINSGTQELQWEDCSLRSELEIALAAAYGVLVGSGISPVLTLCDESVPRRLDKKALQRIFGNILNNAAKYSKGDLSVELRPDGTILFCNRSELSNVDAGKLFDRFYTVETAKGSTGLGLSIARSLTEKLGGSISASVESGILRIEVRFPQIKRS